jgi:hypothetical protein
MPMPGKSLGSLTSAINKMSRSCARGRVISARLGVLLALLSSLVPVLSSVASAQGSSAALSSVVVDEEGLVHIPAYKGSSAGAALTAMSIAWFQKEHLPMPGAIALLCESATGTLGGDSSISAVPLNPRLGNRAPAPTGAQDPPDPTDYLGRTNLRDPLVAPALYPAVLGRQSTAAAARTPRKDHRS